MKTLQRACLNTKCWGPQHWCQKKHLSFPHSVFKQPQMDHKCFKLESMFCRLCNHTHGQRLACSFEIFELPLSLDQKAQTQPWPCKLPVTPVKLPVATRVGGKKTCHQCCTIFSILDTDLLEMLQCGHRTALTCSSSTLSLCSRSLSQQSASGTSQVKRRKISTCHWENTAIKLLKLGYAQINFRCSILIDCLNL